MMPHAFHFVTASLSRHSHHLPRWQMQRLIKSAHHRGRHAVQDQAVQGRAAPHLLWLMDDALLLSMPRSSFTYDWNALARVRS